MSLNEAKRAVSRHERSFFDTTSSSKPFWKQIDASDFSNYSRYVENEFYIRTSKYFHSWESCSLALQNNFLVYRKKKNAKVVEYIDLDEHMYKIKIIYPQEKSNSVKYKHGFNISANGQSFEFYCKEKAQLSKWLVYFRKLCVMADFHETYAMIETIGMGGYGEVRLLQDNATKSKRAGKFIQIVDEKDKKTAKQKIMIINEIKILRKIEHPNIVKLFEVFELGNEICLVMEFIEGQHLLKYIANEKKIHEKDTALIMKQLFLVLNYLASMDIIHRDIKSENIMLVKSKEGKLSIKLIDFGLSTFLHNRDAIKRCGTPGYVAPEILHGDSYDCRVDLYSAGIIMFSCLTGRSPFTADNYEELLERNKKGLVNYKGKNWSQISHEGRNLVQKILEPVSTRISLEEAINHNWLQENLSLEEKKHLNEYRFHIVKMNVPDETRISSVPINSSRLSKMAVNMESNHRYTTSNSFMMSKSFLHDPSKLNSFYKPSLRDLNGSGEESVSSLTKFKPQILLGNVQALDMSGVKNKIYLQRDISLSLTPSPSGRGNSDKPNLQRDISLSLTPSGRGNSEKPHFFHRDASLSLSPSYNRGNSEQSKSREGTDKEELSVMRFNVQRILDHEDDERIPEERPTCGENYKRLAQLCLCFSKIDKKPARYFPKNKI